MSQTLQHCVLLTDSDNNSLLVSCTDAEQANLVAAAAVFSDGGVSAWLWPEDVVHASEGMIEALQDGARIRDLSVVVTFPITVVQQDPPPADPDLYFTMRIRCENQAFHDHGPVHEVTRLLHKTAERLTTVASSDERYATGTVLDINGNDVGSFELSDEVR